MMVIPLERIRSALAHVPVGGHDDRIRIAFALKSELGNEGFDLWDSWYRDRGTTYDPTESKAVWKSARPDGKVSIGTLFFEAKGNGWRDDGAHPTLTPEQIETQRRENKERDAQAAADQRARQDDARDQAADILEAATDDPQSHPYAAKKKKGIPLGPRVKRGPWPQRGWTDALLIPVFQPDGRVWSVEAINVDGKKDTLRDSKTAGGFHHFGKITGAHRVLIGEGIATTAAGHDADGSPAMAARFRGNLKAVGQLARKLAAPNAQIVFMADNDPKDDGTNPGIETAIEAARSCGGVVAVTGVEGKSDFWDLWAINGSDAVREAIEKALQGLQVPAPDYTATPAAASASAGDMGGGSRIVVVSILDFLNRDIPPRERILAPWLLTQSLNMLYAWRGIGKTHVALGVAYASASGGSFLKWKASKPRRVLYIDGEMPAASMQDRLKAMLVADAADFDPDYFRLITPDLQTGAMPDLATAEGQDKIDAVLGDTELIVIDNLSCLARSGGRENDAESWLPIQPWALRQRQQGRSVLFVHHSGKGGAQRGTSKREDILDTVLTLKRPSDYNPADGAVFEVHFEKTRDMHGDEAAPFEARLQTDANGQSVWAYNSVEDSTFDRVVSLANEGLSQKEIAEELGINKSNVSRHIRRATDAGLIQKGGKHDPC